MTGIAKLLYKPLGLAGGIIGGMLAGALFKQLWKLLDRGQEPPKPTDQPEGWAKVLLAGTIKGAVFGGTKAAIDRAGAAGFAEATGVWPGRRRKTGA